MPGTLRSAALVALLAAVAGCSTATDPGTPPPTTTTPPEALYGDWDFSGGILWSANNEVEAHSNVSGDLHINRDKTWSQARYIGTIFAGGEGTFTVKGDTLTLKHNDASSDLIYTIVLGSEADPAGGTRKTLGLFSMKEPGKSWFSFSLREHKE